MGLFSCVCYETETFLIRFRMHDKNGLKGTIHFMDKMVNVEK